MILTEQEIKHIQEHKDLPNYIFKGTIINPIVYIKIR